MRRYDVETMRTSVLGMAYDNIIVMLYTLSLGNDMFSGLLGGGMKTKFDLDADPQGMKFTVVTFDDEDNVATEITLHFVDTKELFVVMKKSSSNNIDMRNYAGRVIESILSLYSDMSDAKEFERIEEAKALFIKNCLEKAELKGFDDRDKEAVVLLSEQQFSKSLLRILKRHSK